MAGRGRRLLILAALPLVGAAPAHAATKTYSTGKIAAAIPDGGAVGRTLDVLDSGPVSFLRVRIRIAGTSGSDLTVSLVSPHGRSVRLVSHRGGNFGTGVGCKGQTTVFEDDYGTLLTKGSAPFVEGNPYKPEQSLSSLYAGQAHGGWTLRIENAGSAAVLECWEMDLSRSVVQSLSSTRRGVHAEISFVERDYQYTKLRAKVVRAGKTLVDSSLAQLGCRECLYWRPFGRPRITNLDANPEPEVVFDLYSGGAHCCVFSLIFGYDPARHSYRHLLHDWGNLGYEPADLDRDGRPELVSGDDRFNYAFTAYAFSAVPIQIWHYDAGRMIDVTRSYPDAIAKDAKNLWDGRVEDLPKDYDVRGILAAWIADEIMLGQEAHGWAALEAAFAAHRLRGDAGLGPTGRAYLAALRAFLRKTGYIS